MSDILEQVGKKVLDEAKNSLGDLWKDLSTTDREKFEECAKRIGKLTLEGIAGKDVKEDIDWVEFRLASLTHLKANKVRRSIYDAAKNILNVGLNLALKAATGGAL